MISHNHRQPNVQQSLLVFFWAVMLVGFAAWNQSFGTTLRV